jgi:ribose/xylose/arabinose/galactoside ABC-type transport system permease subunit
LNGKKESFFKRFENLTSLSVLIGFVVVIVLMQLFTSMRDGGLKYPTFITPVNLLNILMQVAIPGIAAVGMTLVIISGAIDLSVGLLMSLVSIFVAMGMASWGMSPWEAIAGGVLMAIVCEAAMGFIISRVKVEPFIITLGGMMAFRGIALLLCNSREVVLNGELDLFKTNLIEGVRDPINNLKLTLPIYVIIFLITIVVFWLIMKYTKFGRRVYAVGCNAQAAYLSGVNVKQIKLIIFLLNGLLVGIAAVLLLSRVNVGIISLGEGLEIDVIAMVVIGGAAMSGGKGNIWGSFIGILLLGSISNAMNMLRIPSAMQFMVKGIIIIASVTIAALSAEGLKPMDVLRGIKAKIMRSKR